MHKIQEHILAELISQPSVRFADLKPDEIESNLFMYHLRKLMSPGLVAKISDGSYSLTAAGMVYADQLSLKTYQPRLQPRIVTLSMVQNESGDYLLYRRQRQPLFGMVGFPYGKVHAGETIVQAANRELAEKTGLAADLTHRGDGYITMRQDGQVVSQILFHLFIGTNPSGSLADDSKVGQAFWGDPTQVPGWELMPSVIDLIENTKKAGHFFVELSYQLEPAAATS